MTIHHRLVGTRVRHNGVVGSVVAVTHDSVVIAPDGDPGRLLTVVIPQDLRGEDR